MAVTYGFYNSLNGDRLYDAVQMSSIFDGIILDGIFSTIGTSMVVTASDDGMYVNVGAGRAWFNHTWTLNDTILPIEIPEAELVLNRIDAVILEVNASVEVRTNTIKVISGIPASNPPKPTLIHNEDVNQYALAYITVNAGVTTITQNDIENVVGTDETPFITGLLQQLSISELLTQWEADWETYFDALKEDATEDMAEEFAEFDAWFQEIKGQLSEDAAGHLQNEIDDLDTRLSEPIFTQALTRTNVMSGESVETLWGKVKKWFNDIDGGVLTSTTLSVDLTDWVQDTTSQSGKTLYKKQVNVNHVYAQCPITGLGAASGNVLPTAAEQDSYNLVQYVTVDDSIPCLYLYARSIPVTAFYIEVTGVD